MKNFFERAEAVICWLGPGDEDSYFIMETLDSIGRQVIRIPEEDDLAAWLNEVRQKDYYRPFDIRAMSAFLDRPWWGRAWCLQELSSAKFYTFACGSKWLGGFVGEKALAPFRTLKGSIGSEIHGRIPNNYAQDRLIDS